MASTHRIHRMPFGAEPDAAGNTRFALWAPAARRVELCLTTGDGESVIPMPAAGDGWYRLVTERAAAGDRYRYRIDGRRSVPDPASRFQPADVHGPSELVDPTGWRWDDGAWTGRPWHEAVIYELHVGAFSSAGDYAAVARRLDHLVRLGVTAVQLMPIGDFPGARNWGYDGVLPYAPDSAYGPPEGLKALVQAAHQRGLMLFLDVVYNHFGPDGNYLHHYAPAFFSRHQRTPWGDGIDLDGPRSHWVREFLIHNALYWLEEFNLDGLRLDAVQMLRDRSPVHLLDALAQRVRAATAADRHVHLMLENVDNAARLLERDPGGTTRRYNAQWNDDLHHVLHLLLTGEGHGYYQDYADDPLRHLGRCLTEGFAYQGEPSRYRGGRARGQPSAGLPPLAFIGFLQNHDQVGNRALGERLGELIGDAPLRAALALLLLAPSPPLLFMGQEWNSRRRFPFFCDFDTELGARVDAGRRAEFAATPGFERAGPAAALPPPNDPETFAAAILDWAALDRAPHRDWLALHQELLGLRRRYLAPRLAGLRGGARWTRIGERALTARWVLGDGSRLELYANLSAGSTASTAGAAGTNDAAGIRHTDRDRPGATGLLFATHPQLTAGDDHNLPMPPWSVAWYLHPAGSLTDGPQTAPADAAGRHPDR